MKQGHRIHRLAPLCVSLVLGACALGPPAPVEDRSSGDARPVDAADKPSSAPIPEETYRVVKGDTLYAIAFKRGIDFRELAAWNRIAPPYRIFVGQDLHLRPPPGFASVPAAAPAPSPAPTAVAPTVAAVSAQNPSAEKFTKPQPSMFEDVPASVTVSKPEAPPKPPSPEPTQAPKPVVAEAPAAAKPAAETAPPPKPLVEATPPKAAAPPRSDEHVAELNAGGVHWRWPGSGKVVDAFVAGDQTKQGIDIAGKAGEPVQAAADGEVVYSGNGLLGYGELIIVKHNANFLSAYGHNRARLVKEGDKVKAGQQIAEMGSAGGRDELHFEIRKNGKPVNPLDYLPVR